MSMPALPGAYPPPSPRIARAAAFGIAVIGLAAAAAGQPDAPAPAPPVIRAQDVRGAPATVAYEQGRWTVVGLTDRDHKAELSAWFRALAAEADSARARRYVVVALPRLIPPPFRGAVRGAFPQSGPSTYLLDWGGRAVAAVAARRPLPCLVVVAPDGAVADSPCGAADTARVQALRERLARAGREVVGAARPAEQP